VTLVVEPRVAEDTDSILRTESQTKKPFFGPNVLAYLVDGSFDLGDSFGGDVGPVNAFEVCGKGGVEWMGLEVFEFGHCVFFYFSFNHGLKSDFSLKLEAQVVVLKRNKTFTMPDHFRSDTRTLAFKQAPSRL